MHDRGFLVAIAVLVSACAPAPRPPAGEILSLYDRALKADSQGDFPEARAILDGLVRDHPEFYKAYPERWSVIGHMNDRKATSAVVQRDLEALETIPKGRRDDDLYDALIEGSDWLGQSERKENWRREAIARLPKGRIACLARLQAAEEEGDAVRSAAMYEAFLDEFGDDTELAAQAALDRLNLMAGHADRFEAKDLVAGAARWEGIAAAGRMRERDPDLYHSGLLLIAKALGDRAPDRSIEYARKGIALVEEVWPTSEDFEDEDRYDFWPILARAYSATGNWQASVKIEGALVAAIEAGRMSSVHVRQIGEAPTRMGYARALEQTGAIEEARLQIGLASALDATLKTDAAAFALRHPPGAGRLKAYRSRLASETRRMIARRRDHARREVLAREEHRPAPGFTLKDVAGRSVSLMDFRGKTLVLSFWATWCPPCQREMEELELVHRGYRRNRNVAFVGVSTDMDKALVPPFIERNGITFPILLSDGTVEKFYVPGGIPQLYVIDPGGRIRSASYGWLQDEFGRDRLEWMIETARR